MIKYLCCAALLAAGAIFGTKTYTVSHTDNEWGAHINGLNYIQARIHESTMPANEAFVCDSIIAAQKNDIYFQVNAQMQAEAKAVKDSTNKTKKP